MHEGTLETTVRNYLSEFAVRTAGNYGYDEEGIYGVDWNSTYASPVSNVPSISVPTLAMGMTAGWEYIAAEEIYEHSASPDKQIAFVEGAMHIYKPMRGHEAEYGDTQQTLFAYVDKWLSKEGRFI